MNDVVQDLEPQLAEIAGELGTDLSAAALANRLGTPAEHTRKLRSAAGLDTPTEHARELRSAAGLGEPGGRPPSAWLPRTLLWVLVVSTVAAGVGGYLSARDGNSDARYVLPLFAVALAMCWVAVALHRTAVTEVATLPEVRLTTSLLTSTDNRRRVVQYLTSLRPGWFLVRPGLVWLGVLWLARSYGPLDAWKEVIATSLAVITMVAGYRALTDRRWLWLSIPLTGWALGVAVTMADLVPGLVRFGVPHLIRWGGTY